jgi:hypothetical protein
VRYTYFSSLLPLAPCLKPITFVPQQTEKRYSLSEVLLREFSLINPKIEALQVFQALETRIFIVIG